MRPTVLVLVVLPAATLTMSACGSAVGRHVAASPRLPRTVAYGLAARSDALAASLRRGDGCAAKRDLNALGQQARAAVVSGSVPAPYRTQLLSAVRQLAGRLPACAPPPPPAPVTPGLDEKPKPSPRHEHGNGHGGGHRGKHGKHGEGGD